MQLEHAPKFKLETKYLEKIWNGEFEACLNKSDKKYYYWEDIKYEKDAPFKTKCSNFLKSFFRFSFH